MATAATPLTLEEFHRLYDGVKPYREYWFGEVIAKPMATSLHGIVQFVLMFLLRSRGWNVGSEVTLKLIADAEPIPDIVASRQPLESPYPTKPIELCIEIRSPGDLLKKLFEKGKHYLSWGIQNIWIIDPEARTAWTMTHEHPDGLWIHPDNSLKLGEDTVISLPDLFAEVDKMLSK